MRFCLKTIYYTFLFSIFFIQFANSQNLNHEDHIINHINPDWKKIRKLKEKNEWNKLIEATHKLKLSR